MSEQKVIVPDGYYLQDEDKQGWTFHDMNDLISRAAAINALGERPMVWTNSEYELGQRNQYDSDRLAIETVPPVQPDLSDDDMRMIKKLRSFHSGAYAKVIDKLIAKASAQPEKKWIPCSERKKMKLLIRLERWLMRVTKWGGDYGILEMHSAKRERKKWTSSKR